MDAMSPADALEHARIQITHPCVDQRTQKACLGMLDKHVGRVDRKFTVHSCKYASQVEYERMLVKHSFMTLLETTRGGCVEDMLKRPKA